MRTVGADVIPPPPSFVQILSDNPIAIVAGFGAMAIGVWALHLASKGVRAGLLAGAGASVGGILTVAASFVSRGRWGFIVGISFGILPFFTGIAAAVLATRRAKKNQ